MKYKNTIAQYVAHDSIHHIMLNRQHMLIFLPSMWAVVCRLMTTVQLAVNHYY